MAVHHGGEPTELSRRAAARLVTITVLLAALTVLHDLDHLRQQRALPPVLYLLAVGALVSLAATYTVLVRFRRWARPVAIAQGLATVAGVGVVHALPEWSELTDSYSAARADSLSWSLVIGMMVAGLGLALVARPMRGPRRDAAPSALGETRQAVEDQRSGPGDVE